MLGPGRCVIVIMDPFDKGEGDSEIQKIIYFSQSCWCIVVCVLLMILLLKIPPTPATRHGDSPTLTSLFS